MRLCLIPSTICSICLRNCSLAAEDDMALDNSTAGKGLFTEQTLYPIKYIRDMYLYLLVEVVVNGIQQIHLQKWKHVNNNH